MKRLSILISLFVVSNTLMAQKQFKELYNLDDRGMKNSGWHFSPGLTYMIPSTWKSTLETENPDVSEEQSFRGRLGLYAEVGRHHLLRNLYFLDHLDYGISYKSLAGKQESTYVCSTCEEGTLQGIYAETPQTKFRDHFAGAYVNFSNIIQVSDYNFIQNGFGVNADYRVSLNAESDAVDTSRIPTDQYAPNPLEVQIHYKFSFGMKAEKGVFILPSIEVPLLNVVPFDGGRSTLKYFDTGYRPLIFSIKFMFLSKRKPGDCKGSTDGSTGHKLWDKKMRR